MDKRRLKVHRQTVEQVRKVQVEGSVKAPGAESPEYSTLNVRRSSRFLSKKRESSSEQDIFASGHHDCKNKFISESKGGLDEILAHETASVKCPTPVPSFRYHVRSKDGISLVVDLNSSLTEWLKSMENSVCTCQEHEKTEFQSFRQELEYLGDSNSLTSYLAKANGPGVALNSYEKRFSNSDQVTRKIGSWGTPLQNGGDELSRICRTRRLQDDCCPPADSATHLKGFSSSRSDSENLNCTMNNAEAGGSSLLTSANEANKETFRSDTSSTVEDWKTANCAKGTEISDKQENRLIELAYDGPKRKKYDRESDLICLQYDGRILRSTKLLGQRIIKRGGRVLRRSSRLV